MAGDVLLADLAEVAGAGRAHLAQEPADDRQVADDGPRRQSAFALQIITEIPKYLVRGAISGSTDSNRFSAARSPGYMDCFPARRWRYCSTMRSS
ncbi:hypothetical protein [Methylocystis sp. ATCC 49242]|uniref:hypothetical protein n=1 Tax=Methylocystis sp. ATCC 49242 TaxID=622637 RepID=UPI001186BD19|nr:hypothetical protein [Methylocystis sp. ATCC 49242]